MLLLELVILSLGQFCWCNVLPASRANFSPSRSIAIKLGAVPANGIPNGAVANMLPFPVSNGNQLAGIPSYFTYMPTKKHLRPKRLLKRMGTNFNKKWMSIDKPLSVAPNLAAVPTRLSTDPALAAALRTLDFNYTDDEGENAVLTQYAQKTLERWLLERAACRVRFIWRDLGVLFWPRWLRRGECTTLRTSDGYGEGDDDMAATGGCSWPPGMRCVDAGSYNARVLRWQCRRRQRRGGRKRKRRKRKRKRHRKRNKGNYNKKRQRGGSRRHKSGSGANGQRRGRYRGIKKNLVCRWVKVNYPVTEKCMCAC